MRLSICAAWLLLLACNSGKQSVDASPDANLPDTRTRDMGEAGGEAGQSPIDGGAAQLNVFR